MPCSTSANSSGLVLATLDHSNLPAGSNRHSAVARGSSERTSWAYGSMEVSKDIHGRPSPNDITTALMQLAFRGDGPLRAGRLEPGSWVHGLASLADLEVERRTGSPARITHRGDRVPGRDALAHLLVQALV